MQPYQLSYTEWISDIYLNEGRKEEKRFLF